jgi:hypothetical protein
MNITIPQTVTSGNKYIEVRTPGAIHSQAKVWISTTATGKSTLPAPGAQTERIPRGGLRMGPRPTVAPKRPAAAAIRFTEK